MSLVPARVVRLAALVGLVALGAACGAPAPAFPYPETRATDHVDTYHGLAVPDPYRWLEDDMSAETAAWVQAQNAVTFAHLDEIPSRAALKARLEQLYDYERYTAPSRKGEYFFLSKNDGLQNQNVLYRQRGLDGEPEVLIDPNEGSEDGTVRLTSFELSQGGSNGGLLVGAVMNQRSELFSVAIPQVGVMDMLRFHKFTIGWNWIADYGSSDQPEEFKALHAYSPLHNIRQGVTYPATLITTADHDDRVVPAHSFKYAATLQARAHPDRPALIRIETASGHGASSTAKQIEATADIYAFVLHHLGVPTQLN